MLLLLLNRRVLLLMVLLLLVVLLLHVAKDALDGGGLEQSLEHTASAAMLKTLVSGKGVLGAIAPIAELADIQRI